MPSVGSLALSVSHSIMYEQSSPPIPDCRSSPSYHYHDSSTNFDNNHTYPSNDQPTVTDTTTSSAVDCSHSNNIDNCSVGVARRERPSRACTTRSSARLFAAAEADALPVERKLKFTRSKIYEEELLPREQECCSSSKIVTVLVSSPPPQQFPRWSLRSMWEMASVLNFLHIFRPLLNISVEFSAEEFETALMMPPNDTLSDIHIPLMKAIPPITRMALGRKTWVTVLCRKLRDWWYWVAEGEIPIVASHGAEADVYNTLDPTIRVLILKALCDIRVEQEDIRNYIEDSIKHGVQLSAFRKERIGGDSHGISYWYEDDPIIGHRLYREIRKFELKGEKKGDINSFLTTSYSWETVATNLDEFHDVAEKLLASKNRTEVSLGKKVKIIMLPEVEKVHKRKEKLLKKQHREAFLLDNFFGVNGLAPGRSLRDRKPVTYTFDDYDRSINEAIKITKRKPLSPEASTRREDVVKPEGSRNGNWDEIPSNNVENTSFSAPSPAFEYNDVMDIGEEEHQPEEFDLNRGNRRRQRPQRYSAREFVEAVSDNDADFDSDDDIVGEAVYDDEYLKKRKQRRKFSSSSGEEPDEEYRGDDDNIEEEDEDGEQEDDEFSSGAEKNKGSRRSTKLRTIDDIQAGLRRSGRATRNSIDYRLYDVSESESESGKVGKNGNDVGVGRTRFLDLNELAPASKEEEDDANK